VSEETAWDRESRKRLPKYVWITAAGFKMLGVDLMKPMEQQLKKLCESEERQALIKEGLLGEHEEISSIRRASAGISSAAFEALKYRRAKERHVSVPTVWPECPRIARSMKWPAG
jgi:hypothetical protein